MKFIFVTFNILLSISLGAQVLNGITKIVLDHKTKTCLFQVKKSSFYNFESYNFKTDNDKIPASGFKSFLIFSNLKKRKLHDSDRIQLQDKIENLMHEFKAQKLFCSEDYLSSTYVIKHLNFEPTYIEVHLPKRSNSVIEVILIEDVNKYHKNKDVITEFIFSDSDYLTNPSFEDKPRMGRLSLGERSKSLSGWSDCGSIYFPDETPPDIHSKDTNLWGSTFPPSNGKTFVGLVTRENNTWESISQKLIKSLEIDSCYNFKIDVRLDYNYKSATRVDPSLLQSFGNSVVLNIHFSDDVCLSNQITLKSDPVTTAVWQTISFDFESTVNANHITLEAFYRDQHNAYNGNIMIDNANLKKIESCMNQ